MTPTLLLGTEAGEGLGHIAPWYRFCEAAPEHGYAVHMAAPNVADLNQLIGERLPIGLWQSPRFHAENSIPPASSGAVKSWVELLASLGYAQPGRLQGAVKAWSSLLRHLKPHIVLADYAPALMLAARLHQLPMIEVGSGLCVPPLTCELPPFPGCALGSPDRTTAAANALCKAFNSCWTDQNLPTPLACLQDIGQWPAARVVVAPPELDPYGPRNDIQYVGLLQGLPSEKAMLDADNPAPRQARVIGYLKPTTPGLAALLSQLGTLNVDAQLYIPGAQALPKPTTGRVTVTRTPLNLAITLGSADIYLSNGGLHGVGQALQRGCWPIVVPEQAEQVATARNLVQRQWGSLWLPESTARNPANLAKLFAQRPRQSRWRERPDAENQLLRIIDRTLHTPAHVQPA